MELQVVSDQPLAPAQRRLVEQRVRDATRRMAHLVRRAVVRLRDVNGPKGGVDQQCLIELSPEQGDTLVVLQRAGHWRASFEKALDRVVQNLQRQHRLRRTRYTPTAAGWA